MANEFTNDQKDGGVGVPGTTDPFLIQSKVLWNLGWGRELETKTIDAYRKSLQQDGLVVAPERPAGMPAHLNRPVLWDLRPLLVKEREGEKERVSLTKACRLLGVSFPGDDDTLVQHEATPAITAPVRWVWCQDGQMNWNQEPSDCRRSFQHREVGLEALGGLFLFAQDRAVIGGEGPVPWHVMDLPGSVFRGNPSDCACLWVWLGGPLLHWSWGGCAAPGCGSASRWE